MYFEWSGGEKSEDWLIDLDESWSVSSSVLDGVGEGDFLPVSLLELSKKQEILFL